MNSRGFRNKGPVMYETTPYGVAPKKGGFVVKQIWWDKEMTPVFKTREEAEAELVKIAKAAGCYRKVRSGKE